MDLLDYVQKEAGAASQAVSRATSVYLSKHAGLGEMTTVSSAWLSKMGALLGMTKLAGRADALRQGMQNAFKRAPKLLTKAAPVAAKAESALAHAAPTAARAEAAAARSAPAAARGRVLPPASAQPAHVMGDTVHAPRPVPTPAPAPHTPAVGYTPSPASQKPGLMNRLADPTATGMGDTSKGWMHWKNTLPAVGNAWMGSMAGDDMLHGAGTMQTPIHTDDPEAGFAHQMASGLFGHVNLPGAALGATAGHGKMRNTAFARTVKKPLHHSFAGSTVGSIGDTGAGLVGYDTGGRLGQAGSILGAGHGLGINRSRASGKHYSNIMRDASVRSKDLAPEARNAFMQQAKQHALQESGVNSGVNQYFRSSDQFLEGTHRGQMFQGAKPKPGAVPGLDKINKANAAAGKAPMTPELYKQLQTSSKTKMPASGAALWGNRAGKVGMGATPVIGAAGAAYGAGTNWLDNKVNEKALQLYAGDVVMDEHGKPMLDAQNNPIRGRIDPQTGQVVPGGFRGQARQDMDQYIDERGVLNAKGQIDVSQPVIQNIKGYFGDPANRQHMGQVANQWSHQHVDPYINPLLGMAGHNPEQMGWGQKAMALGGPALGAVGMATGHPLVGLLGAGIGAIPYLRRQRGFAPSGLEAHGVQPQGMQQLPGQPQATGPQVPQGIQSQGQPQTPTPNTPMMSGNHEGFMAPRNELELQRQNAQRLQ